MLDLLLRLLRVFAGAEHICRPRRSMKFLGQATLDNGKRTYVYRCSCGRLHGLTSVNRGFCLRDQWVRLDDLPAKLSTTHKAA